MAAKQASGSTTQDRGFLLQEAIRLERTAQRLPNALGHANYGPSLSVLAQAHHELSQVYRSWGDKAGADKYIRKALKYFRRRLRVQKPALACMLYAETLRDANEPRKALAYARRACAKDWFLREAQTLVLELASQTNEKAMTAFEQHVRCWTLVAGEWPESSSRRRLLHGYLPFLARHNLKPEVLCRSLEINPVPDTKLAEECRRAARAPQDVTLRGKGKRVQCIVKVWEFENPTRTVVVGVPAIKVFGRGADFKRAIEYLQRFLFTIDAKLPAMTIGLPSDLQEFVRWRNERMY